MGNFFSDLFYGKSSDPKVSQVGTLSGDQGRLLEMLNENLRYLFTANPQVPGFDFVPEAGALSQGAFGAAAPLAGQGAQAIGAGLAPLTAQNIQAGSQPFYEAMMNQFTQGTGPGTASNIAGQFGALDSARSSGMADRMAHQIGSNIMPAAQQMFMQGRGQQLQGGLGALGAGTNLAQYQDVLAQAQRQGQLQKWQMGRAGMDPRMQYMPLALGTPAFGNMGMPGSQSASPLTGMGAGMLGLGALGWKPFG